MDGRAFLAVARELAAGKLSGPFVSARIAVQALADAEAAVVLLDALEANPARRTAAVGPIPP